MKRKIWTQEEIEYLTKMFPIIGAEDCASHLSRTKKSVQVKASRLNLRSGNSWTEDEVNYIKEVAETERSWTPIANFLGRTPVAVEQKARSLNIKLGRYWTEEEDTYLIENYPNGNIEDLSRYLNRSVEGVTHRASRLGVVRADPKNRTWYLYIIKLLKVKGLHKVGITSNLDKRLKEFKTYSEVELLSKLSGTYEECLKMEKHLLTLIAPYKKNAEILKTGNTETYLIESKHANKN